MKWKSYQLEMDSDIDNFFTLTVAVVVGLVGSQFFRFFKRR